MVSHVVSTCTICIAQANSEVGQEGKEIDTTQPSGMYVHGCTYIQLLCVLFI